MGEKSEVKDGKRVLFCFDTLPFGVEGEQGWQRTKSGTGRTHQEFVFKGHSWVVPVKVPGLEIASE